MLYMRIKTKVTLVTFTTKNLITKSANVLCIAQKID